MREVHRIQYCTVDSDYADSKKYADVEDAVDAEDATDAEDADVCGDPRETRDAVEQRI